jgi:Ca2+-binding EF-hand superfamily protein
MQDDAACLKIFTIHKFMFEKAIQLFIEFINKSINQFYAHLMLKFSLSTKMSSVEEENSNEKAYELTPDEIGFIKSNTDLSTEQISDWYEQFKAKCPEGRLNKLQFVHFFKALIHFECSDTDEEKFCEYVFQAFDTDRNGCIDFAEFLIAFWVRCNGTLREKLSWLFDVYDTDRSGFISMWEMARVLKLVFSFKNVQGDVVLKTKEIFNEIDRNKDGKLSRCEFIAGCTQNEKLRNLLAPF